MSSLGNLLIVSGPSGSGKTTLCRRATDEGRCIYSISCTTRAPRDGEKDGVDYHFLTMEQFESKAANGDFIEYATVHGNKYGTLKSDIIPLLLKGENVVMDIDVQGGAQIRSNVDPLIRKAYADVYIHVSPEELENRLRSRDTDDDEVIALRLRNAQEEDRELPLYQYVIESADRESDYARFSALLTALSLRTPIVRH